MGYLLAEHFGISNIFVDSVKVEKVTEEKSLEDKLGTKSLAELGYR